MEKKSQFKQEILGASFTLKSDEKPEYVEGVVDYLKGKINEIKTHTNVIDPLKIALMAGLNVVDELFKERDKTRITSNQESEFLEMEQITDQMIRQIDESLKST